LDYGVKKHRYILAYFDYKQLLWLKDNNECVFDGCVMPITDVIKKQIAQKRRLYFKVCMKCGRRNPISASQCRSCKSSALRKKNTSLGVKK